MSIKMIWAQTVSGVIGDNGDIPWHNSEDLKRFKELTEYETVVMGRATWESIGSPLSNRRNVVITSSKVDNPKVESVSDIHQVLIAYTNCWVIGGEAVYKAFMPYADELYITIVDSDAAGDRYAPIIDRAVWKLVDITLSEKCYFLKYSRRALDRAPKHV